jgi:hypothetical protein
LGVGDIPTTGVSEGVDDEVGVAVGGGVGVAAKVERVVVMAVGMAVGDVVGEGVGLIVGIVGSVVGVSVGFVVGSGVGRLVGVAAGLGGDDWLVANAVALAIARTLVAVGVEVNEITSRLAPASHGLGIKLIPNATMSKKSKMISRPVKPKRPDELDECFS